MVGLAIFVAVFIGVVFVMVSTIASFGVPFGAFCGLWLIVPFVFVVIVILVIASSMQSRQRYLPPPPPIQQPMVPAGARPPQELACPNCGAAPRVVDRFGIATCDYCNTRFLVR